MSLIRMFFMNVYYLSSNNQWALLAEYFKLTSQIMMAREVYIIPGVPQDKEKLHG